MVKTRVYITFVAVFMVFFVLTIFVYRFLNRVSNKSSDGKFYIPMNPHMYIQQDKSQTDYSKEMDQLNREQVSMDDPRLIQLIRNHWIENPSDAEYNLQFPDLLDPSAGQAPFVDNRMGFKERGFYVECGALDGETRSNTLMLERLRKWNGLLIEADPSNYKNLKEKHRKAFSINACLSIYPFPVIMEFKQRFSQGKLIENERDRGGKKGTIIEVQCFPLYSILLAINVTRIDFFSLDVEGDELKVLQTLPFDQVDIEMMTVEYKHIDLGEDYLKNYVENKGYDSLVKIGHYRQWANDIIFKKRKT
ncbi:protein Star-like [Mytilus galloprovincialis]|uniref:protein Star-like n=1 Tax=Mytilus galloprovincialis TaxID=29158 RepID=UPI003F7C441D